MAASDDRQTLPPLSYAGSWLCVSLMAEHDWAPQGLAGPYGAWLRTVRAGAPRFGQLLGLTLLDAAGAEQAGMVAADVGHWRLSGREGWVEIRLDGPLRLQLRGVGAGLRLTAPADVATNWYDHLQADGADRWRYNVLSAETELLLQLVSGRGEADAPWTGSKSRHVRLDYLPDDTGRWEAVIEEVVWRTRPPTPPLPDFDRWLAAAPDVPECWRDARRAAAQVTWSVMVEPRGLLSRPAMLMSKQWMAGVWSWDHCFNALALAPGLPDLALDQFLLPFDFQTIDGQLPDCVNAGGAVYNFVKPPVHGLLLEGLAARGGVTDGQCRALVPKLAAWTRWWLDTRRRPGDPLPWYRHGNDSGWDNATPFKIGVPLVSPDLAALLVAQCEVLSRRSDDPAEAAGWRAEGDRLCDALLAELWDGRRFVARRLADGVVHESDSLLAFLPIVLGERLPAPILATLVDGLRQDGRFLAPAGLATEALSSDQYEANGYWRGPTWAPSTYLIVQGLRRVGEAALADEIARRFCATCAASGFAENFDSRSGRGLRDRSYSWTASVFLLLAEELGNSDPRSVT